MGRTGSLDACVYGLFLEGWTRSGVERFVMQVVVVQCRHPRSTRHFLETSIAIASRHVCDLCGELCMPL
jgi:hypothetical protein